MAVGARPPQVERPTEPGWWFATDGRWWPPETHPPGGFVPQQGYQGGGGNGMGVAALVLGILAVVFGLTWILAVLAVILAVIGLVLGLVARGRAARFGLPGGLALAGVILSIIGIVLGGYGFWLQNRVATAVTDIFTHLPVDADATANGVRVMHCNTTANGTPRADGTLVNNSSIKETLRVTIRFVGSFGAEQSSGSATIRDVEPGHTADWSVTGYGDVAPVSCEIESGGQAILPSTTGPIQPVAPAG
ncbi:MAG: DUF4190 domain-containing protein [Acidimicrobiia bacterium]